MKEGLITLRGVRVNNLKNIDIDIPLNQLVVITGLSGSGKSSLAFDTLYAEGQRRYVESLSSYARQFMGKISKPDVDSIKGIPPAIAIEQKVISRNPRSTVGTTTEIYEYLKLLFARVGHTFSPISGKEVKRDRVEDVTSFLSTLPGESKIYVLAPMCLVSGRTQAEQLEILKKQGYSRVVIDKELKYIDDVLSQKKISKNAVIFVMIDRFRAALLAENEVRVAGSIETAFYEGKGNCSIQVENETKVTVHHFSNKFERDGITFEEPSANLFSFNNPYGACPTCGGLGHIEGVDMDLVIPDRSLSVFEGGVACWHGDKLNEWRKLFVKNATLAGFPVHRAIEDLTEEELDLLYNGNEKEQIYGIKQFFQFVEENIYKIQYRVIQSRYRGRTVCPDCKGTHLRKDANYVKVGGKSISDLILMPIDDLYAFLQNLKFKNEQEIIVAQRIMTELLNRVGFLQDVGLGYLTLNRLSKTLSGGESQRINLATSLGSSLVGSIYILDEPSIGLHPRDTDNLIRVLRRLRDIGNTVVVVEHDEEIIRNADYIIDIGPMAGRLGGEVVFRGTIDELEKDGQSMTAAYLRGMTSPGCENSLAVPMPTRRRRWRNYIEILGAKEHNLKNIDVKIPLEALVVVTGVSGSGKSTLIKDILSPALNRMLHDKADKPGKHKKIIVDLNKISDVVLVDQDPIGRSSRSNPATYIKVYDDIRELFSIQPLAKQRNYRSGFFSFNVPGGRCEECEGEGVIHIGMQFMADVDLVCTECGGKRFKEEALDVKVNDKDISDILDMTVDQAVEFFSNLTQKNKTTSNIIEKLKPLQDVGLGYLKLGQPSSTLSGGEAQRVKLAFYLAQGTDKQNTLFIFDEPTTGLHFHDINKLYQALDRLIEKGNSIIVIEHNLEIIKCADWIIDLGPEGGDKGGKLVFEGTPEHIITLKKSYTGRYLKSKFIHE
ncbi:MAG: excinuclease ABC subunit UvrA [Bacteroidales bacterium]|nr:excinuclease ABC subunit UvrA [Bacteroidales bacterium]